MNDAMIFSRLDLPRILAAWSATRAVYVPAVSGALTAFTLFDPERGLSLDYGNSTLSPKPFFFPQTECLLRFSTRGEDAGLAVAEPQGTQLRVLFGIRPCDAGAFSLLDRIFCQDQGGTDPSWASRRARTALVGIGCNVPDAACFCTSMGGGPHHARGLDILATDLGDEVLLTPITDRGRALLAEIPATAAATPARGARGGTAIGRAETLRINAEAIMARSPFSGLTLEAVARRSQRTVHALDIWTKIAETCLNCGVCTFTCPTCHCFDIQDETKGPTGRRVRNWDTCMSWLFTAHASGHTPRPTKVERVRQRFLHKFKYMPMNLDGRPGCVGCGRCVRQCPVNIDIREVLRVMDVACRAAPPSGATCDEAAS
ncbi:4Fe-4S dicluster domain-containing protein [Desulfolutivibrio sp.]|uniref:4Fe-4S dicluster domain-containing protein n=1 Tax=Desulfolutivibrio sp. TaxID=2773296 RepID=UPI002F969F5B